MVKNIMGDKGKRPDKEVSSDNKQGSFNSLFNKVEGNLYNYEFGKMLGKGSYAVVTLATDLKNGKKVAIKTYDKAKMYNKTRKTIVEREIQV